MSDFSSDLRFRGLIHQVTDNALIDRLDRDSLSVYAGFDPTADSLHVGNLMQLCTLRRFQLAGHRPIIVVGGATGKIGDPGGKSGERALLDMETLRHNIDGIRPQLARFLEFEQDLYPGNEIDQKANQVSNHQGVSHGDSQREYRRVSHDASNSDSHDASHDASNSDRDNHQLVCATQEGAGHHSGDKEILSSNSLGGSLLLDNSQWLDSVSLIDFLRDIGKHFSVNQMVAKESVKARLERIDQGISFTEFSYMLLQAYDFWHLHSKFGCDLQIGGSDQWGNITMGVELIRKISREPAYGLTTPLVTKDDGTKFGKTESGTVWLDSDRTSPYQLYQFFYNTEDSVVGRYLRYFSFLPAHRILELDQDLLVKPEARSSQRELAREVVRLVHGEGELQRVERAAQALFGEEIGELDESMLLDVVKDAPFSLLSRDEIISPEGIALPDVLISAQIAKSRGEARRAIEQGGIYVNNKREVNSSRVLRVSDLLHGRYIVLRKGKRDYHLVRAE